MTIKSHKIILNLFFTALALTALTACGGGGGGGNTGNTAGPCEPLTHNCNTGERYKNFATDLTAPHKEVDLLTYTAPDAIPNDPDGNAYATWLAATDAQATPEYLRAGRGCESNRCRLCLCKGL